MLNSFITKELELKVSEALIEDVGRGWARLDHEDIEALGATLGDLIEINGNRTTVARITVVPDHNRGKKLIQIDGIIRDNAQVKVGEKVKVKKVPRRTADSVLLYPIDTSDLIDDDELEHFGSILQGYPIIVGDIIKVPLFGGKERLFRVEATSPQGALLITTHTKFMLSKPDYSLESSSHVHYEDIGGLDKELMLVREVVEFPLKHPKIFETLGIEPPKGLLLYGPPGTGKTLIAKAIATETKLYFIKINGPEIIHKYYGESEAKLREIFEDAAKNAPSIIFIDEIDAIAPKRDKVMGDVEKRVVAQLLALMDGLVSRGRVIVIGATNVPEMIDPALRRPGRFDREISIPVPNENGRLAILKIHSRHMPLGDDVDLAYLAQITHGFVGADLEALCKEAAMITLRRCFSLNNQDNLDELYSFSESLKVTMDDFLVALREIEPSATREFLLEKSNLKWEDIGGLETIKEKLVSFIEWPYKYPHLFESARISPPKGILFTGPSGTGKTLMARTLAGETGLNLISIDGPTLFSKWLGESEKAINEIFKKAKQSAPCILFFDEIDALIPKRGLISNEGTTERVASQFFNELDKLGDHSRVIVIGATNRMDLIDPALIRAGRFELVLNFPIPDEKDRLEILKVHTRGKPLGKDVSLEDLAKKTEGMVGSHIANICKRATMIAITEVINNPERTSMRLVISSYHFEKALKEVLESKRGS
jgi:transitional endoplasmic reticulum ATPase